MVLQCVVGKYMKKNVIIGILLLIVSLLTGCDNKNETLKISDLDKYKNISISEIKSIEVEYITLMPDKLVIDEQDKVQNIYETLGNVELVKVSNMRTEDAGMKITIIADNKKATYYFETKTIHTYEKTDPFTTPCIGTDSPCSADIPIRHLHLASRSHLPG